jgi:hypothetical protein
MRWWWITRPPAFGNWSNEEKQAATRIHLIGLPLFAVCCYEIAMFLLDRNFDPVIIAIVSVLPTAVIAFTVARYVALLLWPDLLRDADKKAAQRYASYSTNDRLY